MSDKRIKLRDEYRKVFEVLLKGFIWLPAYTIATTVMLLVIASNIWLACWLIKMATQYVASQ